MEHSSAVAGSDRLLAVAEELTSWQHPFQRRQICIRASVLAALSARSLHCLKAKPASEVGGLLWGYRATDSIVVTTAEFIAAEGTLFNSTAVDAGEVKRALSRSRLDPAVSLIGYFRSYIRDGLCLTDGDQALIRSEIRDPDALFLVIKPFEIGICMGGFFFWRDGGLQTDTSDLEVPLITHSEPIVTAPGLDEPPVRSRDTQERIAEPFQSPVLTNGEPDRCASEPGRRDTSVSQAVARENAARVAQAELPDRPPVRPQATTSRKIPIAAALVALLLIGGSAAYFSWPVLRVHRQTVRQNITGSDIGLHASRTAHGQINLTWNRNSPILASADGATLLINDGSRTRKVELDSYQLRSVKFTYFANTADVRFRLEVHRPDGVVGFATTSSGATGSDQQASSAARPIHSLSEFHIDALPRPIRFGSGKTAPRLMARHAAAAVPSARRPARTTFKLPTPPPAPRVAPTPLNTGGADLHTVGQVAGRIYSGLRESSAHANTYVAPVPVRKITPDLTASRPPVLDKVVRVAVRVEIDDLGRVVTADVDDPNSRNTVLAAAAVSAARMWLFNPAMRNGIAVPADHTIIFEFRPEEAVPNAP